MASEDGYVYYYDLNLEEGGDCAVIKQFNVTSHTSGSKRRINTGNSEEEDDDNNEEEVASSGSPEGSMNVLFSDCSDSLPLAGTGGVTRLQPSLFSQPTVSYADRLRNRHPRDMTGN